MGNRRMISKKTISTNQFLSLPDKSKVLYFMLILNADDDGFAAHGFQLGQPEFIADGKSNETKGDFCDNAQLSDLLQRGKSEARNV